MATAKKTKSEDNNINEAHVVENDIDDVETSPAKREVTETEPMKFTVEVGGEEIELVDHYRKDKAPGSFMMIGSETYAAKYLPGLLETLIGEDQTMMLLFEKGASVDELGEVTKAWAKGRGLSGKN